MDVNKGSAKLEKVFRYADKGFFWRILYTSRHIIPATKPVVVEMAGMIFPAIPLHNTSSARPSATVANLPRDMKIFLFDGVVSGAEVRDSGYDSHVVVVVLVEIHGRELDSICCEHIAGRQSTGNHSMKAHTRTGLERTS